MQSCWDCISCFAWISQNRDLSLCNLVLVVDVVFDLKDSKLGFSIILGCPLFQSDFNCENPNRGYQGCLRLLFINNHQVNFLQIQQESLSNFSQISFDVCNIQDRSVFPIDCLVHKVSYHFSYYYSLCMFSNTVCSDQICNLAYNQAHMEFADLIWAF